MMTVARSRLNDWKNKESNEHIFFKLFVFSAPTPGTRRLGTTFTSDDPVWLIWNRRRLILALATYEHTEFLTVFVFLSDCFSDIIERLSADTQGLYAPANSRERWEAVYLLSQCPARSDSEQHLKHTYTHIYIYTFTVYARTNLFQPSQDLRNTCRNLPPLTFHTASPLTSENFWPRKNLIINNKNY